MLNKQYKVTKVDNDDVNENFKHENVEMFRLKDKTFHFVNVKKMTVCQQILAFFNFRVYFL